MSQTITPYRCPACAARFALEGEPFPLQPGGPLCPCCGNGGEEMRLLSDEEGELWEQWLQLTQRLGSLCAALRLRPGEAGAASALHRESCPRCQAGSWLPPTALHCPHCRGSLGLRRAG